MRAVARVIFELLVALLGIYTLVFVAFAVLPVDPARAVLGANASVEATERLRVEFGLDRPLPVRYFLSLRQMASGEFGESFYFRRPAGDVVWELAPVTLVRTGAALLLGVLAGSLLGRFGGGAGARILRNAFIFLQSVPSFCLMLLMLWAASRLLSLTPLRAPGLYSALAVIGAAAYPTGAIGIFVLDRIAPTGVSPRHIEFLRMLHAPRAYILKTRWIESFPGALMIATNAVGIALTGIAFGEFIFGINGFGVVFFRSCERGDLSVVIAGTLLLSLVVLVIQRVGDTVLGMIDPRIRRE